VAGAAVRTADGTPEVEVLADDAAVAIASVVDAAAAAGVAIGGSRCASPTWRRCSSTSRAEHCGSGGLMRDAFTVARAEIRLWICIGSALFTAFVGLLVLAVFGLSICN
jgi:hypothetical protein